ncbi:MAG: rhomboid family intramembrane serine protease [Leeuwenhoekiella sp.]
MRTNRDVDPFVFSGRVILWPLLFVLLMWVIFWVEVRFGYNFTSLGVLPRDVIGLRGIVFSPFIHSSIGHLASNSVPMLVLTAGLLYFYRPVSTNVLLWLIVLSGLGTWLIGRQAYHIGASGIIYGLASFLFFKGIWSRYYRLIAFSLIVVFIYGSLVWGLLPNNPGVSWEGHLAGMIGGILLALVFKSPIAKPKKYAWQAVDYDESDDPFLRQFDKDGNFIEPIDDEDVEETDNTKDGWISNSTWD